MRLFSIREAPITAPESVRVGLERYRWSFDLNWVSVGFRREIKYRGYEWCAGGGYYVVSLTRHFALGRESLWYDGPHESLSLGFLHFCWS
jgi:hypothetical protein